jgi:hypothetical protein
VTPDNSIYYIAAYIAAAVVYGGYAFSLVLRSRRDRARLDRQQAARGSSGRPAPGA